MTEYCEQADGNCCNPAGYGILGQGSCGNDDPPRCRINCAMCRKFVCKNCRQKKNKRWYCNDCLGNEWDYRWHAGIGKMIPPSEPKTIAYCANCGSEDIRKREKTYEQDF